MSEEVSSLFPLSTQDFQKMAEKVKEQAAEIAKLPNEKQLEIYALFKQANGGDVNIDRPGMLDPKGKAKWDAWDAKKGMS